VTWIERGKAMEHRIRIRGMTCQHCVASVKRALEALDGVSEVKVDLEKAMATFVGKGPDALEKAKRAVQEAGYEVEE
jgi:copper chaperone CopZ